MDPTTKKYYPFGYSSCQYLSINNTRYLQSELLSENLVREIECDSKEKWMIVKSHSGKSTNWNELNLLTLRRLKIIKKQFIISLWISFSL